MAMRYEKYVREIHDPELVSDDERGYSRNYVMYDINLTDFADITRKADQIDALQRIQDEGAAKLVHTFPARNVILDKRAGGKRTLYFNKKGYDSFEDLSEAILAQDPDLECFEVFLNAPQFMLKILQKLLRRNIRIQRNVKNFTYVGIFDATRDAMREIPTAATMNDALFQKIAIFYTGVVKEILAGYNTVADAGFLYCEIYYDEQFASTQNIIHSKKVTLFADLMREIANTAVHAVSSTFKDKWISPEAVANLVDAKMFTFMQTLRTNRSIINRLENAFMLAAEALFFPDDVEQEIITSNDLGTILSFVNVHFEADALIERKRQVGISVPAHTFQSVLAEAAQLLVKPGAHMENITLDAFAKRYRVTTTQNSAHMINGIIISRADKVEADVRADRVIDYGSAFKVMLPSPVIETKLSTLTNDYIDTTADPEKFISFAENACQNLWLFDDETPAQDVKHVALIRVTEKELLTLAYAVSSSVVYMPHLDDETVYEPVFRLPKVDKPLAVRIMSNRDMQETTLPEIAILIAHEGPAKALDNYSSMYEKPKQQIDASAREGFHFMTPTVLPKHGGSILKDASVSICDAEQLLMIEVNVEGLFEELDVKPLAMPLVDLLGQHSVRDVLFRYDPYAHDLLNGALSFKFKVYDAFSEGYKADADGGLDETNPQKIAVRDHLVQGIFNDISDFAARPLMQQIIRSYGIAFVHAQAKQSDKVYLRNRFQDATMWLNIGFQLVCQMLLHARVISHDNFENIQDLIRDNKRLFNQMFANEPWVSHYKKPF